jgi:hypothetical protein
MAKSDDKHQEALRVLNEHYIGLAREMAEEIVECREEFESFGFGQAENIIEKYARHIQQVDSVYGILQWMSKREKPEGKMPLGKYDFRCFGCGGLIQSTDDRCQTCGWTWV